VCWTNCVAPRNWQFLETDLRKTTNWANVTKLILLSELRRRQEARNDIQQNDTWHKGLICNTQHNTAVMLSVVFNLYSNAECYTECHNAQCLLKILRSKLGCLSHRLIWRLVRQTNGVLWIRYCVLRFPVKLRKCKTSLTLMARAVKISMVNNNYIFTPVTLTSCLIKEIISDF